LEFILAWSGQLFNTTIIFRYHTVHYCYYLEAQHFRGNYELIATKLENLNIHLYNLNPPIPAKRGRDDDPQIIVDFKPNSRKT